MQNKLYLWSADRADLVESLKALQEATTGRDAAFEPPETIWLGLDDGVSIPCKVAIPAFEEDEDGELRTVVRYKDPFTGNVPEEEWDCVPLERIKVVTAYWYS